MGQQVIQGYADEAAVLIARYEAFSSPELYAPVVHLMPGEVRVIDIGAGTGRDAAWFAARECHVLAVEPVAEFREAGATLHQSARIEWLDDALPTLSRVLNRGEVFGLVVLNAVWHHLTAEERRISIRNVRKITAPDGLLTISLRHGPGPPARPCFELSSEETIELFRTSGFQLVLAEERESIQPQNRAAGVTWTWLAFWPAN